MTCGSGAPTCRLLDGYVGWDPAEVTGLAGLADPDGLRLARPGADPDAPSREELLAFFPDRRLAPGPHGWYLATDRTVLHRGPDGRWAPVWSPHCGPEPALRPIAVAAAGHWLAVAEPHTIRVWWREGEQLATVLPVRHTSLLAIDRAGALVVAVEGSTDLRRYAPDGTPRGLLRTGLPGRIEGIRLAPGGRIHLLTEDDGLHLWTLRPGHSAPAPATLDDLTHPSTLVAAWDDGFCLRETGPDGWPVESCYDWRGCPLDGRPPAPPGLRTDGELRTLAIDSGIPRCRWHRVVVEADLPGGTAIRLAVAVTEEPTETLHESDWQQAPAGSGDFLVDQPPGRYLLLRLALTGDGTVTPVVRRVRLDFPRHTSADLLPAAYRQDPAAEDFTERFLSLFDASLADIDRVIERYPALLDADGVPDEALPWLGGLLGLAFEAGWTPEVRRALLAAAPRLYRRRGTPGGLAEVIQVVTGVTPEVEDQAAERSWLPLGGARLGGGRLFGRSAARFRLGTSALGGAPLRGHGDPGTDPLTQDAYRFRVTVPPGPAPVDDAALRRLVAAHAPAHTVGTVHRGGLGWVVGVRSTVGVDTALVPLPATVLGATGDSAPVLGRQAVVGAARRGTPRGIAVGDPATAVGVGTVAW